MMGLILTLVAVVLGIVLVVFIYKRGSHKRKFNENPHTSGEGVDPQYEDDDEAAQDDAAADEAAYHTVKTNIVRSDDKMFDTFVPIQQLFEEAAIVDVQDGLIEFDLDNGEGYKVFVGIAEMEQSNPYLKTNRERQVEDAEYQLFLASLGHHAKISLQWQVTDMHAYFNKLRRKVQEDKRNDEDLTKRANEIIDAAQQFEHSSDRFENHVYVQFIEKVKDSDIADAETKDDLNRLIYETANRKIENDIGTANDVLRVRHHELQRLYNIDLLELIYKTFNRKTSRIIPFDSIIREQKFGLMTTAAESDSKIDLINNMVQVEEQTNTFMKHDDEVQKIKQQMLANYQRIIEIRQREKAKIKEDLDKRNRERIKEELAAAAARENASDAAEDEVES